MICTVIINRSVLVISRLKTTKGRVTSQIPGQFAETFLIGLLVLLNFDENSSSSKTGIKWFINVTELVLFMKSTDFRQSMKHLIVLVSHYYYVA